MEWKLRGFLPFEELTINTELSPDEVKRRLSGVVEPPGGSGVESAGGKPYQGRVEGDTFKVRRVIGYRNMFLPVVKGVIRPEADGSSIRLKMGLRSPILVFVAAWLGFSGVVTAMSLYSMLRDVAFNMGFTPPFILLLLGYAFSMVGFKVESTNAKTFLRRLFTA